MKTRFNIKHKEVLDTFLLEISVVNEGKMYGHPAYYVGGKLFASLFDDGVCIKVPISLKEKLLKKNHITSFEPMGRKMKEWILINRENSEDYIKDKEIFKKSIEYVASIPGINFKKK